MAYLLLEDNSVYRGSAFGSAGQTMGEVVFNTGMTGYQEVLTDPSYCGQIVMMTYPLIGNYGVNWEDPESHMPQVRGFVVRELCQHPSNWHSEGDLDAYLKRYGIMGIEGIDTRAITRKLRDHGTMRGMISLEPPNAQMLARVRAFATPDPVRQVTCAEAFELPGPGPRVAVLDCGLKASMLSSLRKRGCHVWVYPSFTPAADILKDKPDLLLVTNGPGNPNDNPGVIAQLQQLLGRLPAMGICLGHQLIALACGARSIPLRYGHRGTNHPVKDLERNRVYITSQNHGYVLDEDSLLPGMTVSHRSWNDRTIEGIRYTDHPTLSVQFHPEASPGPRDTAYLFDRFMEYARR